MLSDKLHQPISGAMKLNRATSPLRRVVDMKGGENMPNQDWIDYTNSLTEPWQDKERYSGNEYSDEFYGLAGYREYTELWN